MLLVIPVSYNTASHARRFNSQAEKVTGTQTQPTADGFSIADTSTKQSTAEVKIPAITTTINRTPFRINFGRTSVTLKDALTYRSHIVVNNISNLRDGLRIKYDLSLLKLLDMNSESS